MRITIWASTALHQPDAGPFKAVRTIERDMLYAVGDMTDYGQVIKIPPRIPPYLDEDQHVFVNLDPSSVGAIQEHGPSSYNNIEFAPIVVELHSYEQEPVLSGVHTVMESEGLTIENVAPLLTKATFSLWNSECFVTRDTTEALQRINFSIVHRYTSKTHRDAGLETYSADLVIKVVACLALIRPTRKHRVSRVTGVVKDDGMLDPHGFTSSPMPVDVPEIQRLFTVREQDIDLLRQILPEFLALFEYDANGRLTEAYEPMRMAIQLYNEAYDSHYWKARHILWWSAIEALYGTKSTAAIARIYGLFGKGKLDEGFKTCIYEKGDIPWFFTPTPDSLHTLGEMVPMIYAVRNFSAHGQRVPDSYFTPVAHPTFGSNYVEILSEALTLIIRKTIVEVLLNKHRERFKDRNTQEDFWLHEYYLPKKQCKRKLNEMLVAMGKKPIEDERD